MGDESSSLTEKFAVLLGDLPALRQRAELPSAIVERMLADAGLGSNAEVVAWFSWCGGDGSGAASVELVPGYRAVSLADALGHRRLWLEAASYLNSVYGTEEEFQAWSRRWLPVLMDPVGDGPTMVYDTAARAGAPRVLHIERQDCSTWPEYDGLRSMADTLRDLTDQRMLASDADGQCAWTDRKEAARIRARHNPAWVAEWMRLGGGDGSLESLVATLRRGPSEEVPYAVEALVALHATEVMPAVAELMSSGEEALQHAAARVLLELAEGAQVDLLISAAGDEELAREPRKLLLNQVGEVAGEGSVNVLLEAVHSRDPEIRMSAARSLAAIGRREALAPCLEMLRHRAAPWRWTAAQVLGELGDPKAVAALAEALEDDDDQVVLAAAAALSRIGDRRVGAVILQNRRLMDQGTRRCRAPDRRLPRAGPSRDGDASVPDLDRDACRTLAPRSDQNRTRMLC